MRVVKWDQQEPGHASGARRVFPTNGAGKPGVYVREKEAGR